MDGIITGFCGLAGGHMAGTINLGGFDPPLDFSVYFTEVSETVVLTGLVTNRGSGQTGTLTGTMEYNRPTPITTTSPYPGYCLVGTAVNWPLLGHMTADWT
jgi:hypothetical protein